MMKSIKTFLYAESGAVTVDWVVLAAALVGLGLAAMGVVSSSANEFSTRIEPELEAGHGAASQPDVEAGLRQ